MAQLVFVHGVATRGSKEYVETVKKHDALFRQLLFTGQQLQIHTPMWGDTVSAIDARVFDTRAPLRTFSLNIGAAPGLGFAAAPPHGRSVIEVGKQDPLVALDAICSSIADSAAWAGRSLNPEELVAFRKATELIASGRARTLFDGAADEQTIVLALQGDDGTFGIGSVVGAALASVSDRIWNAASTLGFDALRDSLSPAVARFMGDVFVYLKEGPERAAIRAVVREALVAAQHAKAAGDGPLILVGHSLGGVILVDMLSDPAAAGLDGIEVDALLTVGSQPGLFASLGVLTAAAGAPQHKPDCIKLWMNVFDAIDPLAFRAQPLYSGVEDFVFNSVAGIMETHSKYFQRPQFYARARVRLAQAGIL